MKRPGWIGVILLAALALPPPGCSAGGDEAGDAGPPLDVASDSAPVDLPTTAPDLIGRRDTGASQDAGLADGAGGCVVQRVSDKTLCGPDCDVRLLLPGGDYYCSRQCTASAECTAYGVELVCPAFGACVPGCTKDDACVALGFKLCDEAGGNCDTI